MNDVMAEQILAGQARIERKLDALISALAEDADEDEPRPDLDGNPAPRERDQSQSLG